MKIRKSTHLLLITLVVLVIFSGSLKNDFVWDDKYLVIDNPYIRSSHHMEKIFTTQLYEGSGKHSSFYRPLQSLTYLLNYSVWGLNPFGYRLTNLYLHIFNSMILYLILAALCSSASLAFLIALIFGIAPTISGITYYISARSDLLMAFFMFLSILFFIKYAKEGKNIWHIFSVFLFIPALICKEMALALLLLMPLQIYWFRKTLRKKVVIFLPYLLIGVSYIVLRITILNFARGANSLIDFSYPASIPLFERILTIFKIIPKYIEILLLPNSLHMEWFIEPIRSIFQIDMLLSVLVFAFLVFIIRKLSRAHPIVLFGAIWFLLGLLPVLNIYPISVFFGEGWLYVPSVGFFIIIGVIFQNILRVKARNALIALFLLYYSLFTIAYGKVWKDSISLFKNVLKYETKSPFVHLTYNNLSTAYYDIGDFEKSLKYGMKSISSRPTYQDAYNNIGVTYMALGRPVMAITYFKRAISLKRDYGSAYRNLAHAYSDIGLVESAIRYSKASLKIAPDSYKTYCNLGYIFLERGDTDKAIELFKEASRTGDSYSEPHHVLGNLYLKNENFKDALYEYERALNLGVLRDHVLYNEIAFLYIKNNRFKDAEKFFKRSLVLNSDQAETHNNLGNLYSMLGLFEVAIDEYRMALKIEPENKGIADNIKKTKTEWKEFLRGDMRDGKTLRISHNTDI